MLAGGQKEAALRHAESSLANLPEGAILRCRALYAAARVRWRLDMSHPEHVLPMVDAAKALLATTDDPYLLAGLLSLRAWLMHAKSGDAEASLALQRRALLHWQAFGNRHAVNQGRYNVAVFEFHAGHADRALAQLDEVAAEAATLKDWRRLSAANDARGNVYSRLRRWPQAADAYRDSMALAWRAMSIYNLTHNFWNLPRALAHLGQPELALRLAGFAEVFWVQHGGSLTPTDERDLLRVRRLAARQLGRRERAQAWAAGRLLSLPEAVTLALDR
jgi:tetratricopeptide (TPR) repeat protein